MRKYFVLILLCSTCKLFCQDTSLNYIDISQAKYVDTLRDQIATAYVSPALSIEKKYNQFDFQIGRKFRTIPPDLVAKKVIGKFKIANSSDSERSVYFFPGFYFDDISLFRQTDHGLVELPRILPEKSDSLGYRLIVLPPHDSAILF